LGQADPIARELGVSIVAVWVKSREKLIGGEGSRKNMLTLMTAGLSSWTPAMYFSRSNAVVPFRALPSKGAA
jgi:hypothetical protein